MDNDEKVASSKKICPIQDKSALNHILFMTKMAKIDTLFMTKTAEKPYLYSPYKVVPQTPG